MREALNLLRENLPVLEDNFSQAHAEYMAGDIPAGAMRHVRDRLGLANEILSVSEDMIDKINPDAMAILTMDLRHGVKLQKWAPEADFRMQRWIDALEAMGFTQRHPIFDTPMRPRPEAPELS